MRRSISYRVKLGSFYLQGDAGWGALKHATPFTLKDADKQVAWLNARGIAAVRVRTS